MIKILRLKVGRFCESLALLAICILALSMTGCANNPAGTGSPHQIGALPDAGRAVATLLAKADSREQKAQWEQAAAMLERALRIEPRNARLWHRLARIRLQQGRYAMAESLAQKSNALAKDDEELKQSNAELIEAARGLAAESKPAG
jgi:tetratricopeptide (TPR) repeat protein